MNFDLILPGRASGDDSPDDYEAQSALRTLLEAHKIVKTADEDLFGRMRSIISYNKDCLDRVDEILAQDDGESASPFSDAVTGRTDTRTVDDFFDRFNKSRAKERAKNLTPIKGGKY